MTNPALPTDLRNTLERTVKKARVVAEAGARAALKRLAVGAASPHDHLSDADRELRNTLRARARALGDARDPQAREQATDHLVHEVAYEHWHALLFARFLAARGVLQHPEGGAVSIEDCAELAADEGAADGYTLAARYAALMLPALFRPDDPVLALPMAPEHRLPLIAAVEGLPEAVFHAWDSLGWVYQFWQADAKDAANASGDKIGADTLPAVTQLFTEGYMVDFLLHNTLGAWWTDRHPGEPLPVEMPYLRLDDDGRPAAGGFTGWPDRAADLRVLDPSCGSGHFLVAALNLLVPMRQAEGSLDARAACDAVLRDQLHGLELEPRCTQIAAFNLALAAWTYPGAGGYRTLPALNVACAGLAPSASKADWRRLAGTDALLAQALDRLYEAFREAPTLGSLVDPLGATDDLGLDRFKDTLPRLVRALERDQTLFAGDDAAEGVVAQGLAEAARLLAGRYTLVVTNVPYLGWRSQDKALKSFATKRYPEAKADLATVFSERCLDLAASGGTAALVTPQNWLFLGSYEQFRLKLLKERTVDVVARLGPGAFETISGEIVNVGLFALTRLRPQQGHSFAGVDAQPGQSPEEKAELLKTGELHQATQEAQLQNPDARITLDEASDLELLGKYADGLAGVMTGDAPRYQRQFWEVLEVGPKWVPQQTTQSETCEFGGLEYVVDFDLEARQLRASQEYRKKLHYSDARGTQALGKTGVTVSSMGSLPVSLFTGTLIDNNAALILPHKPEYLPAIWAFCSSPKYTEEVRRIDQALKVTNSSLVKVPFDLQRWTKAAQEQYPNGLPEPHSDDPTQWLFEGDVASSTDPLQTAVTRLVGYRWPAQSDDDGNAIPDALDAHADDDGIVPLVAVRGEPAAEKRLRDLLATAYGDAFSVARVEALLADAGYKGKSLDRWLRDGFFAQHLKRFNNRPFVWHVWDGRKDGFGALVLYHKLDRALLEKLAYGYLGDWITAQTADAEKGAPGADLRLAAARDLQDRLALILEGEPPHDLFVRWKPASEQPIGWAPDLDDGVLVNVRPFAEAGVLRRKTKVQSTKDRGKNPDGSHWGPDRYNRYEDVPAEHKLRDGDGKVIPELTNAARRYARRQAGIDG
ncbi:Eco57I restriction-modification methylase domain-containing protein [Rubrivirga sp. IMCC45206]|uniref:Eco57I restriction-modification methylase domain-containing protein n=1 Tax=Rubrivirga sp. IMCC45206 TaxID=3391614 RepID=UPI00398F91B6